MKIASSTPDGARFPIFLFLTYGLFCAVFFGYITAKIIFVPDGPSHEFGAHINFAMQMINERRILTPHFLYQLLTIAHYALIEPLNFGSRLLVAQDTFIRFDWALAGFVAITEVYIAISISIAWWYIQYFKEFNGFRHDKLALLAAFGVSIASPIFIFSYFDGLFYLGYIVPSTIYIIPTQVLLKLSSFWLFVLSASLFNKSSGKITVIFIGLVLLNGLSKPNWLIVMVPTLFLVAMYKVYARQYINWKAVFFISISAVAVLGWQYYFKFIDPAAPIYKSNIIITAPFEVWRHYSNFVYLKIILSIVFPLYVLFLYLRQSQKDFYLIYAWLLFTVGIIYTGFLGESGPNLWAGNFIWSGEIACFALFISSTAFFFKNIFVPNKFNNLASCIGIILFFAHVLCGIIYYVRSGWYSYE